MEEGANTLDLIDSIAIFVYLLCAYLNIQVFKSCVYSIHLTKMLSYP